MGKMRCISNFSRKTRREEASWNTWRRWKDDIKIDFTEGWCEQPSFWFRIRISGELL
jgi:hypothetical protein